MEEIHKQSALSKDHLGLKSSIVFGISLGGLKIIWFPVKKILSVGTSKMSEYNDDLALDKNDGLICHKIQLNQTNRILNIYV